jgi:hypothetical protein
MLREGKVVVTLGVGVLGPVRGPVPVPVPVPGGWAWAKATAQQKSKQAVERAALVNIFAPQ